MNNISGSDESTRITIMKHMGATQDDLDLWLDAKKEGQSFESFLKSLIDRVNGGR